MRILIVHNRYREMGGEDVAVEGESQLLERNGHAIHRLYFDNTEIQERRTVSQSVALGMATVWSTRGRMIVKRAVQQFKPDVAHFHNTLPLVSPAAYSICRSARVPVVQTLHNYRLICANGLLYRDGKSCMDCMGRTPPWPSVVHSCYRGSAVQTAAVATMLTVHRLRNTWQRDVGLYIALTRFARTILVRAGLPEARVVVKPNFADLGAGRCNGEDSPFLFVGRLTEDKGVRTLLRAWGRGTGGEVLEVVGDGPLARSVAEAARARRDIRYLGRLDHSSVIDRMRHAKALIVPSLWYEGFPMVIVEALACGLPIIASKVGALPEIAPTGEVGLHCNPGDGGDLADRVVWLATHPAEQCRMSDAARRRYEDNYTGERNYARLQAIYERAIALNMGG